MFENIDDEVATPGNRREYRRKQTSIMPKVIISGTIFVATAAILFAVYSNRSAKTQTPNGGDTVSANDGTPPDRKSEPKQPKAIPERKPIQALPTKEPVQQSVKPKSRDEQFAEMLKEADELFAKMKTDETTATARRVRTLSQMEKLAQEQYCSAIEKRKEGSFTLFPELEQMGLFEFVRLHRVMRSRDDPAFMKVMKSIWVPSQPSANSARLVDSMEVWGKMYLPEQSSIETAIKESAFRGIEAIETAEQRVWINRLGGQAFLEELANRK